MVRQRHVTHTPSDVQECVTAVDVVVFLISIYLLFILLTSPFIHPRPLSFSLTTQSLSMQEAIPYRTYLHAAADGSSTSTERSADGTTQANSDEKHSVEKMVLENAVVVIGRRGCCMNHVVRTLLLGHGVNPASLEVDEADEAGVADDLSRIKGLKGETSGASIQFPAVFVGGKLFGGLDQVMATHISGELVPILKDAGALWL
ncbi:glutaredoxin-C9-like [Mangifera indica]|uniref:glutaredoxin-C9-like n=1 Tax=Mangifera indica TaxID=29780 RepID=UPI001CFB5B3B|nr:glutaredoxin-C9-like [Mangifera indica]